MKSIQKNKITHIFPANSLQQGFIYHAISQSTDDAYRLQLLLDYHYAIDIDNYIKAWEMCIEQYPILRTAFNWKEEIVQVIYRKGTINYALHDLSHLGSQQEKDAAIKNIQVEDRKQSFDLTKPTLLRLHIIKQSAEYYTVLKSDHHSISDGWSNPILLKSLHQYYQALMANKEVIIKEDTAYLEAQEFISLNKTSISNYWNRALAEVESVNDINSLLSTPVDLSSYKKVEIPEASDLTITGDKYKGLKVFCQQEGITLNVLVQFLWHKLLQVYSSSTQTIVGTTISGRDLPIEGIEESVGLYINTLPLIINWQNDNSIRSQLLHIQEQITAISSHSFADLAKLQKNGERLFHSLFVFENYPVSKVSGKGSLKVSMRNSVEKVDYPLSILAYEHNLALTIKLEYDDKLLTAKKANYHIETLQNILDLVIKKPNQSHRQISLLLPEEYNKIVYQWNVTDKDYPKNKTLYELFQEQVKKTLNNTALVYEGQKLTYNELNERSNQLARHIRDQYHERYDQLLRPDTLIALCLHRSLEMVVSILAVLKAGGAYVPIDPSYPQERIDYMLEDMQAKLVLSQRQCSENNNIQLPEKKVVYVDLAEGLYNGTDTANLPSHSTVMDMAYVIYTSGTTGKPKGVMVEHRGVVNLITDLLVKYDIKSSERFLFSANFVFDASVEQIFTSLLSGGTLFVINKKSILDSNSFTDFLIDNRITHLDSTPSYLSVLEPTKLSTLKRIAVGGEHLPPDLFRKYKNICTVINEYGPTEASIVSHLSINSHLLKNVSLQNVKSYVLDNHLVPVPVGVAGELYIGGAGLARGYLNNKDLTAERFIFNPFATAADEANGYTRLYKTGDLVRWLEDNNLEYIGRNDDQVKIRGYRIELGEIEHALTQIKGIKQSCVLTKEKKTEAGSTKYLAGYYVLDSDEPNIPAQEVILEQLSMVLPDYMVPTALVAMESFPLTVNGKLDRHALPDPDFNSEHGYVAPVRQTEIVLCKIWQEVLGVERVGVTDIFFQIGGNSILAIRIAHRMSMALGFDVSVADVFKYRTIAQLILNTQPEIKEEKETNNNIEITI
jgi:amino acid adenylation domain-containing protein